jgi:hypothetical protein
MAVAAISIAIAPTICRGVAGSGSGDSAVALKGSEQQPPSTLHPSAQELVHDFLRKRLARARRRRRTQVDAVSRERGSEHGNSAAISCRHLMLALCGGARQTKRE